MLKNKFFKRSIISNLIIFTVPFVVTSLLFAFHYLNILRKSVTNNQMMTLAISEAYIKSQTEKLDNIVSEINYNRYFARISTTGGITLFDSISSTLQATMMSHVFDNVYVYFSGQQYLYSDSVSCSLDFFSGHMYDFTPYYSGTFSQFLNSITSLLVIPASNIDRDHPDDRYVTFFYPLYSNGQQNGVIFFMLNEKRFDIAAANSGEKYLLFDKQDCVISKSASVPASEALLIQDYLKSNRDNNQTIALDGKSYLLTYSSPEDNKLFKCVLLVPSDNAFSSIKQSLIFYMFAMLVLVIAGGMLVYFLTRFNYKPIRALMNKSRSIISDQSLNEVDLAAQTIDFLQNNNLLLQSRLQHYSKYLLLNLLLDTNSNEERLRHDCAGIGIVFDKPFFQVFVIHGITLTYDTAEVNAELSEKLEKATVYYVDTQDGHASFIANIDFKKGLTQENMKIIKKYLNGFENENSDITLSVGKVYSSIEFINKSYMQAMITAKYQSLDRDGKKPIMFYCDIPQNYTEEFMAGLNAATSGYETDRPKTKLNREDIIEYIDNHYLSYTFSLQEMAEHFGVHMSYLSQYFNSCMGITVNDYVIRLKIEKAKEMLVKSNHSIDSIGEMTGYTNVSSFIRRFKQVCGVTPGEYRHQNQ